MNFELQPILGDRERGLRVREGTINFFSGSAFRSALHEVVREDSLAQTLSLPAAIERESIQRDMMRDPGWREEYWELQCDDNVERLDGSAFHELPSGQRFSHSDCLRHPQGNAFALRGMLSGLHSPEVLTAMTAVVGSGRISYMTADIARYRPGHYLRRHDDVYDGRVFGLVFFLHADWERQFGARLKAEKPDGRSVVVEPLGNTVAVMRLADGHYHQVEQNLASAWDRYSVAVHFGIRGE